MHSYNRDEIAETSLEDNECNDECTRVHECSSVQTGLALDNSMNGNGKSPPVARVHGFSGGYEEEGCAVDSAAAIEPSPDDGLDDIPSFLDRRREAARVCAQCGAGRPGDLPTFAVTAKDGTIAYVHEHGCLKFWLRENQSEPQGEAGTCP